jgi:ectoine hydroxylase-related dioxygenase (phytanoyl-CoA dioxygenase family)
VLASAVGVPWSMRDYFVEVFMKNHLPGVPLVESPLFKSFFNQDVNSDIVEIARNLNEFGFVVVRDIIPNIQDYADKIIRDLAPRFDMQSWKERVDIHAPSNLRIQDAWREFESVRRIANSPEVINLLTRLYGRKAFPFQTLNFPVGTQQHFHTDAIHFSSYPERFMAGVWIALEDIEIDQGPLYYYPGTHKLPLFENVHYGLSVANGAVFKQEHYETTWREIVESLGIQKQYFCAKKGDILIWAANLLHGGSAHRNLNRTRWSQVTHYYFEDCYYYTPMNSDFGVGAVDLRTPQNQVNGEYFVNKFNGTELPKSFLTHIKETRAEINSKCLPSDWTSEGYLSCNPDVKASGQDPLNHYLKWGRFEGRKWS